MKSIRIIYRSIANGVYSWLFSPKRYRYLFQVISEKSPSNIMEIGTWNGSRAIQMIKEAINYHEVDKVNYYGFDLFEIMDEEKFKEELSKWPLSQEEVERKLSKTGANIHLFKGDTTKTLPATVPGLPQMDFIFIDGGHSLETILNDWKYTSKLMHDNTIVLFDDYWPDKKEAGAKSVVDGIDKSIYDVEIMPISDYFKKTQLGPLAIQMAKVSLKKS